jgi:hypothetical protein
MMTGERALLDQLNEYHVALERLHSSPKRRSQNEESDALALKLLYLEQRVLAVQTELYRVNLMAWSSPREKSEGTRRSGLWRRFNPWHPDFYAWSYITVLTIFMVAVILLHIAFG